MKTKEKNILISILLFSIFLEGLDAFSVFEVPLPWFGVSLLLLIIPAYYFFNLDLNSSNFGSLKYWIIYVVIVTIVKAFSFDLEMPQYATSSFSQFVSLRVIKIISFFIVVWVIQLLASYFTKDQIIESIAYIGLIISLFSLYSYFSYFLDLPDFNRSRAGSGGWTQPIQRACSILRNYGTFREPSFLAVWTVPFIPLNFYLARKSNKWYFLSIFPIFSLVLTRSLTGIISLLIACLVISILYLIKNKKVEFNFIFPVFMIVLISLFANNISYKFPPLDPSMCPPNSADKCDCSIYDDNLDEAKNSENIAESIFSRAALIVDGGIDGFGNFSYLKDHLLNENLKIFGDGLGSSNIIYSYEFEKLTAQVKSGETVYRNPGQVVSFNNLYANIYFSSGLIGLIWFLFILFKFTYYLFSNSEIINYYLSFQLFSILLMFFFQAEEVSTLLGVSIGLIILEGYKNE